MMKGIWAAVLTPVDRGIAPDAARAIAYYGELLARGCDGINLLGTTGEAMSWSLADRVRLMETVAGSGLPMDRAITGTGSASLDDAVRLTRTAFECGFAAALIMPPFFYRDASDDGVLAFFDVLFSRANPPLGGVLLYNFPRMSGIAFHAALVDRLLVEFPGTIAGMKDSSNDPQLQAAVIGRHPGLRIFPGSESDLLAAMARGAAGCISGSVALWPELAQRVFANGDATDAAELTRRRAALDGVPFIAAVRHLVAQQRDDLAWDRALPPNSPLTAAERKRLSERVGR
jgi:4-hydroxy-tetrahydrodipicolinate synthase